MRLPTDVRFRALILGAAAFLGGCALIPGGGKSDQAKARASATPLADSGPAADYPMVLGDPFTVAGTLYTPADTLNYDEVGYAALDAEGGQGVTVAHKTLPLPSYVEITSLDSGQTILARVERRGPMSGNLVALSPGARAQLGAGDGAPVRVRRVNPPEVERAELRAGNVAPLRMETPKSLVAVLRRKLPENGSATLATARPASVPTAIAKTELPPSSAKPAPAPVAAPKPATGFDKAFAEQRSASTAYPLAPLDGSPRPVAKPAPVTVARLEQPARPVATPKAQPKPEPARVQTAQASGDFVVQAAAFSVKANADRAAGTLGGFVSQSGKFYRVRTGPFATRGQAEAALAKVRAAGYSDARVTTAG